MDYEKMRDEIDNLIFKISELNKRNDNSKYEILCYKAMINDLEGMKGFFCAKEFKETIKEDGRYADRIFLGGKDGTRAK